MGQLGSYQEEVVNEWRQKVINERDLVVHKIEEMLNNEVKQKNKELKRRQKLEDEFKSNNMKCQSTASPSEVTTSRQAVNRNISSAIGSQKTASRSQTFT